jgi:signal transduction histidine kinase
MSLNILAVEDDRDALDNLRDILEMDGHRVTGLGTLKDAIDHLRQSGFSVILLDRRLPDGTADALLPHIQESAPHAAVIVITGYADLEGTIAALRQGVVDYLLKPINPDLLRAAIARVARLREMEERTRQSERLAGIGQMMTVLSHESGNVLARSQALVDMLTLEVQDRPFALELLGRLQKSQDDLHRLYEEVRNFAAPITLDHSLWSLGPIWRQAWDNVLATRADKQGVRLDEKTAGVDLDCEVDNFRLEQVFRNLFDNSLAASAAPVRVEVACSDTTLHSRPAVRINVRDNGPGLTAEQKQRVFAPFYTTKRKGTGLGLAIVKRIVEAHGGMVAVGDGPPPGAEFVITLPRQGRGTPAHA